MVASYDCQHLMQYVARAEADVSLASSSMDDSNPPQLVAHSTTMHHQHFLLLLAYTKHAMAAQLYWIESEEPWNTYKDGENDNETDASTSKVW